MFDKLLELMFRVEAKEYKKEPESRADDYMPWKERILLALEEFSEGVSLEELGIYFGGHPGSDFSNLTTRLKDLINKGKIKRMKDPRSVRGKYIYFLLEYEDEILKKFEEEPKDEPKEKDEPKGSGVWKVDNPLTKEVKNKIKGSSAWKAEFMPFPSRFAKKSDKEKAREGEHLIRGTKEDDKNVTSYTMHDRKPTGKIGATLEKLIKKAKGAVMDTPLYRGINVKKDVVDVEEWIKKISAGDFPIVPMKRPTSWSNGETYAWDFARRTGHRASRMGESILFRVLASKGTKGVYIFSSFSTGEEIVLSRRTKVKVTEIERYRTGYRITGILV